MRFGPLEDIKPDGVFSEYAATQLVSLTDKTMKDIPDALKTTRKGNGRWEVISHSLVCTRASARKLGIR